jgi:hypothetical protein
MFGLDPRIAALTFLVDAMVFGGTLASGGLLLPVAVGAGCVLGFITYRAQRRWYGDDAEAALIKACIIGLLTAIPSPLPAVLYIPSAILGVWHLARARWARRLVATGCVHEAGARPLDVESLRPRKPRLIVNDPEDSTPR